MDQPLPDAAEIARYVAGTLPEDRFAAVDAYLATLDEDETVRLLEAGPRQGPEPDPPPRPDEPATNYYRSTIRHRFQDRVPLARGGMGRIDLIHDRVLERAVALKRCHPRSPDEPVAQHLERRRRFLQEALITARLEHPAIVPVHDVGQDEFGEPTMVLKHLEGEAFDRYLARATTARQRQSEGIRVLLRVCEALAYAHAQEVVHRDLKPENIVVGRFGTVSVIDWGLAASVVAAGSDDADPARWCGTPAWMPPEQMRGVAPDRRADVWGIGALLAFVATDRPPRSVDSSASETLRAPPINPGRLPLERLPRSLQAVARRCLSHDPAARYPDAAAVLAELRRWQVEGITAAEGPGAIRRVLALLRRHRKLTIAGLGLVACLGLIVLSQAVHHQSHISRTESLIAGLRANTSILDLQAVEAALAQLDGLHGQYGDLAAIVEARAHFRSVAEQLRAQRALDALRWRLDALEEEQRTLGPRAARIAGRLAVLRDAGITWRRSDAADVLARHPLREALLRNLATLAGLFLIHDRDHRHHAHEEHAAIHVTLEAADPAGPWAAVGHILEQAVVQPHDLRLPDDLDRPLATALAHPPAADLLLALIEPDAAVRDHVEARLSAEPAAFWPRLVLARIALMAGDIATAREHALIARGRADHSVLPLLQVAYADLLEGRDAALTKHLAAVERIDPGNLEAAVIAAADLARRGRRAAARERLARPAIAAHLALHGHGQPAHPMDLALDLLHRHGVDPGDGG